MSSIPSSVKLSPEAWNQAVLSFPRPHLLQSWQWAEIKASGGWQPRFRAWRLGTRGVQGIDLDRETSIDAADFAALALILQREVRLGGFLARFRMLYVPKGPLLRDLGDTALVAAVLADLQRLASRQQAIYIKVDPDIELGRGIPGEDNASDSIYGQDILQLLRRQGWRFSSDQVQFRNTVILDLTASLETLLSNMKQKTRYNIRLAERKGVAIRQSSPADHDLLYRMYAETAARDGFVIREAAYYRQVWDTYLRSGWGAGLIAEVQAEPVAALTVFRCGPVAYYFYGMSREAHREKMPNYLLQWEAIKLAKSWGCQRYDLWGAPDDFHTHDPMWGVYRFKEGLGGQVVRHLGAYDFPARPLLYWLYNRAMPLFLGMMRRRGRQRLNREAV